ncbi:MAG: carboxypeptidase-like regulatory domain-containing protein, partial [bacterium]
MKKQCLTKRTIFLLSLVMLFPALLFSQGSTGKITGVVIDSQTKEALPGANVMIQGTLKGAATDTEGRFFIIGVPPGTYFLKVTFVGYATIIKENVRVSIGRTTPINFEMKPETITGEEVTVYADRERVKTDISFTQTSLTDEEVRLVPVGPQLRDVLRAQVGVELDDQGRLSIRGSGYDEVGFVVDGVSQSDARFNVAFTNIPKAAIKEVQVLTGGFNAEYGQARSGLINIVTKEGGDRLVGSMNVRYRSSGLKHRGPNIYSPDNYWDVGRYLSLEPTGDLDGDGSVDFKGWKQAFEDGLRTPAFQIGDQENWKNPATAEEALEIWKYRHRGFDYGHEPDYYLEGTLGGPVPYTPFKFFFSGFYNKEMFPFPMIRPYYGELNTNLKLSWDITSNLNIKLIGGY